MALRIEVDEAHAEFDDLMARIEAGEEVLVERAGTVVARVVAVRTPSEQFNAPPDALRRSEEGPLSP